VTYRDRILVLQLPIMIDADRGSRVQIRWMTTSFTMCLEAGFFGEVTNSSSSATTLPYLNLTLTSASCANAVQKGLYIFYTHHLQDRPLDPLAQPPPANLTASHFVV
jgi:hypothetical protein